MSYSKIITSDYRVTSFQDQDTTLLVDASSGNVNIFFPYAIDFDRLIFKKIDLTSNNLIFFAHGLDLIENSSSFSLNDPGGVASFCSDRTSKWYITVGEEETEISNISDGPFNLSSCYKEITTLGVQGGFFPDAVTWWLDDSKNIKIFEKLITRNDNQFPIQIVYKSYSNNILKSTITDTISYLRSTEVTRTRVKI